MRFEIQLILWVTALALAAASLFIGRHGETNLSSFSSASIEPEQYEQITIADGQAVDGRDVTPSILPNIDPSTRGIFPNAVSLIAQDLPQTTSEPLPTVAGIFSVSGRNAAMVVEGGAVQARLVEVGDPVGGFIVKAISAGEVVLERIADGKQESVLLRGSGELP